jgi:hypothetical protein
MALPAPFTLQPANVVSVDVSPEVALPHPRDAGVWITPLAQGR